MNKIKDNYLKIIIGVLIVALLIAILYIISNKNKLKQMTENEYNMAFYELVDYVQNVETFLAKSLISSTPEHGAETLTNVWREANLAQAYLAMLPIDSNELSSTEKFLNQVSDYSYTLSRKNINNQPLTEDDFKNLSDLHNYSLDLENTLNQLSADINDNRISWGELTKKGDIVFAKQVSNVSKDSFSSLEENFHEYAGLIYDGAFSEHITSIEKKGLTGDVIEEEQAKNIVKEFIGEDKIDEIITNGLSENGNIPSFDFKVRVKNNNNENIVISVTQKGGHILFMNYNRDVMEETVSYERAVEIGKEFLNNKGFQNMKETYYLKQQGILTINFASTKESSNGLVIMYPDLIKIKVALDNGEIMGIETTGYLNSHYERNVEDVNIGKEEAKRSLNKSLQIESEGLAVIPTEFQTEILCWEFKGKVEETEFLVYINATTGKEEDILVIKDTLDGILTM